jgi:hypothetical protein
VVGARQWDAGTVWGANAPGQWKPLGNKEEHIVSEAKTHHSTTTHHKTGLDAAASAEHKAARTAHHADSLIYEAQALSSGNPKRIERYFLRKLAYRLFGRFMAKTVNRL